MGLGTRIKRRNTRWGTPVEGEMAVTEWEPERALGTLIRDANMEIRGRATFESASPDQTLLTILIDVPGLDASRAEVMRERLDRTVENIKSLVETEIGRDRTELAAGHRVSWRLAATPGAETHRESARCGAAPHTGGTSGR